MSDVEDDEQALACGQRSERAYAEPEALQGDEVDSAVRRAWMKPLGIVGVAIALIAIASCGSTKVGTARRAGRRRKRPVSGGAQLLKLPRCSRGSPSMEALWATRAPP